ncbi:MAG TPA: hypothetical protein ENN03_06235 [bacterium]|nr:hypothetical protein [bacterium]
MNVLLQRNDTPLPALEKWQQNSKWSRYLILKWSIYTQPEKGVFTASKGYGMKRNLAMVIVLLLAAACARKPSLPYDKESPEYAFFKTIADSMDLDVLNPDKPVILASCNKFKVWNVDIMPGFVRMYLQAAPQILALPREQLVASVHQLIDRISEDRLLDEAAQAAGISVEPDAAEQELLDIAGRFGGIDSFRVAMENIGMTLKEVRQDIRNRLSRRQYVYNSVLDSIPISEDEVKQLYGEDLSATVRHILFVTYGKSDSEKDTIRNKAQEILNRIHQGEPISDLARQYSEDPVSRERGGLYENIVRGQMSEPFEQAAFSLPVGDTDLIETEFGIHIMQVIGRQTESRTYARARPFLIQTLLSRKRQEALAAHVEQLKDQYKYKRLYTEHL